MALQKPSQDCQHFFFAQPALTWRQLPKEIGLVTDQPKARFRPPNRATQAEPVGRDTDLSMRRPER